MKWLGADPTTADGENPTGGILGNGHQTSPQMLRNPQVRILRALNLLLNILSFGFLLVIFALFLCLQNE
jgi:hypothetical protein